MKNLNLMIATLICETGIIKIVSLLLGWKFIDTIFLGGLLLFGAVYLYRLIIHQENTFFNAHIEGWTWQEKGISPFQLRISPIIFGMIIFVVISFIITLVAYWKYFFN